jgi:hypothetical protein
MASGRELQRLPEEVYPSFNYYGFIDEYLIRERYE